MIEKGSLEMVKLSIEYHKKELARFEEQLKELNRGKFIGEIKIVRDKRGKISLELINSNLMMELKNGTYRIYESGGE